MTGKKAIKNMRFGSRGFTLVELMVVIAIIGILVALGVGRVGNAVSRQRLNSAATGLGARLRQAKVLSISRNAAVTVVFDVAGNNYYALFDADRDASLDAGESAINLDNGNEAALTMARIGMPQRVTMYSASVGATNPVHATFVPPSGLPMSTKLPAGQTALVCFQGDVGVSGDTYAERYEHMRVSLSSVIGKVNVWMGKPGQASAPTCSDDTKWEKYQ